MLREPRRAAYPFGAYWWLEINPHEYQIRRADPAQTIIGRLVEIPASGRAKGRWVLPDANQEYPASEMAVMGLELWHKMDVATAPPAPPTNGHAPLDRTEAAIEAAIAQPAMMGMRETAKARGVALSTLNGWLIQGKIPGAVKIPDPVKSGLKIWQIPADAAIPPVKAAPALTPVVAPVVETPPAPVSPPPAPKLKRVVVAEPPAAPPDPPTAELYREIGRLLGRVETLEKDVRFLALRQQATPPPPAPTLWQRLTGANEHNEAAQ